MKAISNRLASLFGIKLFLRPQIPFSFSRLAFVSLCFFCAAALAKTDGAGAALKPGNASPKAEAVVSEDSTAPSDRESIPVETHVPGAEQGAVAEVFAPIDGFLFPIEGEVVNEVNLPIVLALDGIQPSGMLLTLDGYSVPAPLGLDDGLINAKLENLTAGMHEAKLMILDGQKKIAKEYAVRFYVRIPEPKKRAAQGRLKQFGRVMTRIEWKGADAKGRVLNQAKVSLQDTTLVAGKSTSPLSQDLDGALEGVYSAKLGSWEGYAKGLLRMDESVFRQPSHRLSTRLSYGPWMTMRAGDIYPMYHPLVLDGTRIRGGEFQTAIVTSRGENTWGSFKAVLGESKRFIPAYIAEYDTGNGTRLDTVSSTPSQTLMAGRVGFGGGPSFDFGLTVMRAKEAEDGTDAENIRSTLNGIPPSENVVGGADLRIGMLEGRIQLYANWASSLFTRDRSLGAFNTESSDISFNPQDYENVFVFNATTRGWPYLLTSQVGNLDPDPAGFLLTNSAYETGITTSLPFEDFVNETELTFQFLGADYHSEGNPFLGQNPGRSIHLLERVLFWENRLSFAFELGDQLQESGFFSQEERAIKGEIRYIPGGYRPGAWIGGGLTRRAPDQIVPLSFTQDFSEFHVGGLQAIPVAGGRIFATGLYALSHSSLKFEPSDPSDSNAVINFPATLTHIASTSAEWKLRGTNWAPRLGYLFSANGVQEPTHGVTLGSRYSLFDNTLRTDAGLTMSQYPKSPTENDVSFGESLGIDYILAENHTLKFRERVSFYGDRRSMVAGVYYEGYF